MRFRMLFGLPFACLALACALTFLSAPSPRFDYGAGIATASYQVPDLSLPVAFIDHVAMMAREAPGDVSADGHKLAYTIANQPLASWRVASDMAYRHIDPHIWAA